MASSPAEMFQQVCAPQLAACGFPEKLLPRLLEKLVSDNFDAGSAFSLATQEDAEAPLLLVANTAMPAGDEVWLVDHAWTFRMRHARQQLDQSPGLRTRLMRSLGIPEGTCSPVDAIFAQLWRVVGTYTLVAADGSKTDDECVWYWPDEVGTAMTARAGFHVDVNCIRVPLLVPWKEEGAMAVDVMWLTADVEDQDVVAADPWRCFSRFTGSAQDAIKVLCDAASQGQLLPHLQTATSALLQSNGAREGDADDSTSQEDNDECEAVQLLKLCMAERRRLLPPQSGYRPFRAPSLPFPPGEPPAPAPLRVYTDSQLVFDYLTDEQLFTRVTDPDDAHVMWLVHHPMQRSDDHPNARFVSQFPEERHFVTKNALAATLQRHYGRPVPWLPLTFDATSEPEVMAFMAEFAARIATGDDNTWITKPHNLARSMDMNVHLALPWLLKFAGCGVPKVLSKYVHDPCTFRERKCDMRFVVALRSLAPLELYVHNNFLFRFSAEPFSLSDFEMYEKHFTVMNYRAPDRVVTLHDVDFVREFDEQYGAGKWQSCLDAIHATIRDAFAAMPVDAGLANRGRFRAIYGVDMMVTRDFLPRMLEITFSPDNRRLCKQRPTVFNELFATLFYGSLTAVTRLA